jgi:predicted transcriptional regulator
MVKKKSEASVEKRRHVQVKKKHKNQMKTCSQVEVPDNRIARQLKELQDHMQDILKQLMEQYSKNMQQMEQQSKLLEKLISKQEHETIKKCAKSMFTLFPAQLKKSRVAVESTELNQKPKESRSTAASTSQSTLPQKASKVAGKRRVKRRSWTSKANASLLAKALQQYIRSHSQVITAHQASFFAIADEYNVPKSVLCRYYKLFTQKLQDVNNFEFDVDGLITHSSLVRMILHMPANGKGNQILSDHMQETLCTFIENPFLVQVNLIFM